MKKLIAVTVAALALSGCMVNPPPAPQVDDADFAVFLDEMDAKNFMRRYEFMLTNAGDSNHPRQWMDLMMPRSSGGRYWSEQKTTSGR